MKSTRLCIFLILSTFATYLFSQSFNAYQELSQGVEALKHNKIEDAIRHLKTAVSLDDKLVDAHVYLATALASEYIPGVAAPENVERGEQAIEEYKRVLNLSPENINSIKGLASLAFNMKKFEEAKEHYRKAIDLQPGDAEIYYAIAVIDWSQVYTAKVDVVNKLGLEMSASIIEKSECWTLHNENEAQVREGIDMIEKALELRPSYDDAMAYLNLLYRERADIQCGDKAAYSADIAIADNWVDKAMAVKKARAEGFNPGGAQQKQ